MNIFKFIVVIIAIILFVGIFIEKYSDLSVKLSLIISSIIIIYTSFIKKNRGSENTHL
jgi:hypothetical protein